MTERSSRSGIANVWVVLLLPVLVGFVGFGIDFGYLTWVGQQLQNAADAAALAGVQQVRTSIADARLAAVTVGAANNVLGDSVQLDSNDGNAAEGDIVVGRFDRDTQTFTPDLDTFNAVKVVARRTGTSLNGPVPLLFGRALGFETTNMAREAIAMVGGGTGNGLICLSPDDEKALYIHGDVELIVNGGAVQVNSTDSDATWLQGSISLDAATVNTCGGINVVGSPYYSGDLNPGADAVPDPLAYLPAPVWDPAQNLGAVALTGGGTQVIGPGYYSGGLYANNGTLSLLPGIYVLDGVGLNISGNASLIAEGVMFYLTGSGKIDITGGGTVRMTPPDPEQYSYPGVDTYEGVTIFQARDNLNGGRIIGTSLMDLEGTLYFPSNFMELGGDATKFGNQLIVYKAEIHGNGTLIINYDGRFPAPGNRPFLVA